MSANKNLTINQFLKNQNSLQTLRFITCGSVDDGKSTLIGRMLFESQLIFDDQIVSLEHDSKKSGTQGEDIDFALLVDGLAAEREQGITIDVAYRYFATDKRKFIVADTPGHEQYTRNMITGASTADAAIILVDARNGLMTQTKRHSYLCSLMGIKNIITDSTLKIYGNPNLEIKKQVVIKNFLKDHRVFMTSVIGALSFGGSWHIHDKDSIKTSFPSFLKTINILKK